MSARREDGAGPPAFPRRKLLILCRWTPMPPALPSPPANITGIPRRDCQVHIPRPWPRVSEPEQLDQYDIPLIPLREDWPKAGDLAASRMKLFAGEPLPWAESARVCSNGPGGAMRSLRSPAAPQIRATKD